MAQVSMFRESPASNWMFLIVNGALLACLVSPGCVSECCVALQCPKFCLRVLLGQFHTRRGAACDRAWAPPHAPLRWPSLNS